MFTKSVAPNLALETNHAVLVDIPPAKRRLPLKKLGLLLLATTTAVGIAAMAVDYWDTGRFEIGTDDAYVAADSTAVAPKVSGYVKDVLVADNQPVRAGDVLAHIDDADFRTALEQAQSNAVAARADVANLRAQIEQQKQAISAAQSNLASDRAAQGLAQQDHKRYADLMQEGYATVQRVQQSEATIRQTDAAVARDQALLASALKQSDVLAAQLARAEAAVAHDDSLVRQAELNLGYTTLTAPVDGTVGARALRVGAFVQAGTQLAQVVPLHAVYVTANFKETQLTHVQPGQKVAVEVDTFPGVKIAGHVQSLSPASGQEFALLPPDNATGNFTKIVQRIPVKIVLEPIPALKGKLRPGMSVEAIIDTKPATGTALGAYAAE
jgi:membrane fusion protein (multidrug efflux system)